MNFKYCPTPKEAAAAEKETEQLLFTAALAAEFGGAQQALKAVQDTPAPYKYRRAKKRLKKLIRTYAFRNAQGEAPPSSECSRTPRSHCSNFSLK